MIKSKYIRVWAFLLLPITSVILFSACSSSDDYVPYEQSDLIVKSETSIAPAGGDATIVVREEGCKAASNATWLTAAANGTTITLTAPVNDSQQSRNALVTITAPSGKTTSINVSQQGLVFVFKASDIYTDDAAFEGNAELNATNDARVLRTPDWITTSLNDNQLHYSVAANTTGKIREGYIVMQSGTALDSMLISQCEAKDLYGQYTLDGHNPFNDKDISWAAHIEEGPNDSTLYMWMDRFQWRMELKYDQATHGVSIAAGQLCGTYSQWYVFLGFYDEDTGYMTATDLVTMKGEASINSETGKVNIPLADDGSWSYFTATTISFLAYKTRNIADQSSLAGTVVAFSNASLIEK